MDNIKSIATGTIITLLIGGTIYSVSQEDVARNLAEDTGMTQEQAELYINQIPEEDLDTFSVVGDEFLEAGRLLLSDAQSIDCVNYEYEWESPTVSCAQGKAQIIQMAENSTALGHAYKKLDTESATDEDIAKTIQLIDRVNADNDLKISSVLWDTPTLEEAKKTNSYNKSLLKAALESDSGQ